ncbi:unnamed protein product [Coffea canephora]|uniref:Uncharacterized protein n=1 Tax=Coffea canephora TaxID=49390 RepID=A0A068V5K8_COFCA|nr:unnamed protein product [Coffea canephora]
MSEKDLALKQAMYHITTSFGKGSIMWLGCSAPVKQVPVVSTDYNGPCRGYNQLGSIGYSTEQFFSKLRKPNTA